MHRADCPHLLFDLLARRPTMEARKLCCESGMRHARVQLDAPPHLAIAHGMCATIAPARR